MLRLAPRKILDSAFRTRLLALCALAPLAACSHQPSEYFWSSADSGEYLFAFDTHECGQLADASHASTDEPSPRALRSPSFFACMQERGYFLVDPQTGQAITAGITQEPRRAFAPQAGR